jgi:hypothetical protein
VLRGGKSFGNDAHWQRLLRIYISPFTTSRSHCPLIAAALGWRN